MNSPRIIRPNSWISIPELGLQKLSTGVIEAASILTAVLDLTAQFFFGACLMRDDPRRRSLQFCQRGKPQTTRKSFQDPLRSWDSGKKVP